MIYPRIKIFVELFFKENICLYSTKKLSYIQTTYVYWIYKTKHFIPALKKSFPATWKLRSSTDN